MRTRVLLLWLLIPSLVGVLVSGFFVARSVSSERAEASAVARLAVSGDLIQEANAWIASEITNLLAIEAFTGDHPSLRDYEFAAEAARDNMAHDAMLIGLEFADTRGAEILDAISALDSQPELVRRVLAPIGPETMERLRNGERGLVDPAPYAAAAVWARDNAIGVEQRARDARDSALSLSSGSPYWQDSTFIGFTMALGFLAVAGALLAAWRVGQSMNAVSSRLTYEQERAAELRDRGVRLQHLISFGRQMSAEADVEAVSRRLVVETHRFIGGDAVVLARCEGSRIVPTTVDGNLVATSVAIGDGVVGRCAESGAPARILVPSDPFLAHADGPLSLLAAPLVAEGRVFGVLVVAKRSNELFDETQELALHVLVLLAASAVTAAERLDFTRALTLRDPLTGLANRRKLDDDLTHAAVSGGNVAFLMVDIDHFKAFNDRNGHQRGDDILRATGRAIASAVREVDSVYRYGGEEFSVLLPGADAIIAGSIAERVRAAVRAATHLDDVGPVTVSIGVASLEAPFRPNTLVADADSALYAAKEAGRDRVLVRRSRRAASEAS